MPKRFSQETNVDEQLTSKSFCQNEERRQICHQFGKCASILSTIPLTSQTSIVSEGSRKFSINFESSLPDKFVKNQQITDLSTNFEELYPRTDVQELSHSELSKNTSISSEFSEIPNCLNLGNERKLSDIEEAQVEQQSGLIEEGLKMKMNIVLMPKDYQSPDEHIRIEEQQIDQETISSKSISFVNSTATTTTYESTQDSPIINS